MEVGFDCVNFMINSEFLKTHPFYQYYTFLFCFVFIMTTFLLGDRKSTLVFRRIYGT